MDVGKRITCLRTAKNYSVNKLANLSGISQSYLRDIELGNKNPTVEILSIICNTLEISLRDFFDKNEFNSISEDPLLYKIYQLNSAQRTALMNFLDTMIKE